jgi:cytochrome c553
MSAPVRLTGDRAPFWALLSHRQPEIDEAKFLKLEIHMKKTLILGCAILAGLALTARADDAKATFEKDCAKCHGADGKGQTKMGQKLGVKDYTDAKVQAELKDDAATKAIKEGLKDKEGKVLMKPAESLSDSDIKGLIAYIRTFKK